MSGSPRVPAAEITGVYGAVLKKSTERMFGEVPAPLAVMWHNRPVLRTSLSTGRSAGRWHQCDESLKAYAHMAATALVGCSFCLDLGYYLSHHKGLDVAKAREVPRWRESSVFAPLERDVLEYAEAMSQTPPTVTDEMVSGLLGQLGAAAVVELTAWIGFANQAARTNVALGVRSQGFSAACGLAPLAQPSGVASRP